MSGAVVRRANNLHRNITVTPFLNKLYSMVDDSASDDLIRWSDDGNSFLVIRHEEFSKEVLPRFFKHSNFSSFVRQLNMYGFHKVPHLQQGGLISDGPDADSWEFSNDNFQRGQPDLLHFIRRKKAHRDSVSAEAEAEADADEDVDDGAEQDAEMVAASNTPQKQQQQQQQQQQPVKQTSVNNNKPRVSRTPPVNLGRILKEVQVIRDHQLTISSDIKRLQQENQSLWMQAAETDDRSKKQQETIDKILRFLATVFSSDIRQSEIHLPLRRLISHNGGDHGLADSDIGSNNSGGSKNNSGVYSTNMDDSGRGNNRSSYQSTKYSQQQQHQQRKNQYQAMLNGKGDLQFAKSRNVLSTPRTQSIFEEMDFPDSTASGIHSPPSKRMRTEDKYHPTRIFEMSPGAASSSGSSNAASKTADSNSQRKVSSASSRADVAASSNAAARNALVPSSPTGSMLSRLSSHSKSIDRLGQDSDAINHSLEALMRLFSPAAVDNNATDHLSASGGGPDAGAGSHMSVDGVGGQNLGGLAAADLSNEDSLMHLFSSDEFNNLAMSLANTASAAPNNPTGSTSTHLPAVGAEGSSSLDRSSLANSFGYTDGQQQAAAVSAMAGAPDFFGTVPAGNSASNNSGNYNAQLLLEAIRSLTPEQQQNMLNYYRLTGQLNHMPLLTAGDSSNITHVDSPEAINTTPFLEFVDPNAEQALGVLGSGQPNTEAIGAQTSGVTNADYNILFSDAIDPTGSSGAVDVGANVPSSSSSAAAAAAAAVAVAAANGLDISGIDPTIAASLFQTAPILTTVAQPSSNNTDSKPSDQVGRK
ncbi:Heat shock transcription factor [Coemansia sp. RSA 1286]|nr:Heat shock transcription factor [Coemansia sp. RSA 1286]